MIRSIKETPVSTGKDTKRFSEAAEKLKSAPKQRLEEIEKFSRSLSHCASQQRYYSLTN